MGPQPPALALRMRGSPQTRVSVALGMWPLPESRLSAPSLLRRFIRPVKALFTFLFGQMAVL